MLVRRDRPESFPSQFETAPDRVASGRYRPEAPTDPYVLALEHTVLQIMGSLPSGTQHGYPFLFR